MKIAIVGGCFTNQHNIPFDKLYHQTLKRKIGANDLQVEIRTIRYERISKCLEKIIEFKNSYPFDYLLFHLRAEPVMRLAKLYYKYLNAEGKLKHALNIPMLKIVNSEKYDLLLQIPTAHHIVDYIDESKLYHLLREFNYMVGSLIGNKNYALNLLEKVVLQIQDYCTDQNIRFLLLGPVSRPFSKFEDRLSEEINDKFEVLCRKKSIFYLNLLGKVNLDYKSMFFENGIHVSQEGHDRIAIMIYEKLSKEC